MIREVAPQKNNASKKMPLLFSSGLRVPREFGILPFLTSFRVRVSSRWGDDTNEKEESQGEERNNSQDEQKVPMPNNNNNHINLHC